DLARTVGVGRRFGCVRGLRPVGAPASDSAGYGLDRSPGPSLRLRSRAWPGVTSLRRARGLARTSSDEPLSALAAAVVEDAFADPDRPRPALDQLVPAHPP